MIFKGNLTVNTTRKLGRISEIQQSYWDKSFLIICIDVAEIFTPLLIITYLITKIIEYAKL